MTLAERYTQVKDTRQKESSLCAVAKLKRVLSDEDTAWFATVEYDRSALATDVVQAVTGEYGDVLKPPSLRRHRLGQCECTR